MIDQNDEILVSLPSPKRTGTASLSSTSKLDQISVKPSAVTPDSQPYDSTISSKKQDVHRNASSPTHPHAALQAGRSS